jgi:hypothetical protein
MCQCSEKGSMRQKRTPGSKKAAYSRIRARVDSMRRAYEAEKSREEEGCSTKRSMSLNLTSGQHRTRREFTLSP